MQSGWMEKIIRVNLTDGTVKTESLNRKDAELYAGGRGLATKYYINEADPETDPFAPENNLIFMTGPLTGTAAACAGRCEAVSKEPLTGMIGACGFSGNFGPELKYAGYDGIIFEGRARNPVYLYIKNDFVELRDAVPLWGMEAPAAADALGKVTDEDTKIVCIGQAGEKMLLSSGIMADKKNAEGRSKLGAVMGFKKLKAIAVRGTNSIRVAKSRGFLDSCLKTRETIKANPVTGKGLTAYQLQAMVNIVNGMEENPAENPRQEELSQGSRIGCEDLVKECRVRNSACFGCASEYAFLSLRGCRICGQPASEKLDFPAKQEKNDAMEQYRYLAAAVDCMGICPSLTFSINLPEIAEMFRTCTGLNHTDEEVLQIGERTCSLETLLRNCSEGR